MSSPLTVHDVMTREFLGVTEGDELLETVSLLLEDGASCAVVLRGRDPVGVVSERDALSTLVRERDPAATTVADAMSDRVVRVAADASLAAAAGAMAHENADWLLATADEPVGVITAHDIVVASTMAPDADPTVGVAPTDPEAEYDTQGICESCGTLARGLADVNGRLVCPNCRDS